MTSILLWAILAVGGQSKLFATNQQDRITTANISLAYMAVTEDNRLHIANQLRFQLTNKAELREKQ